MSDTTSDREDKPKASFRRTLLPIVTKLAHGSAPFITTFTLIHLTAPLLANLGGSSLSSQVMLLGREYYQSPLGEKLLVIAPLIVHPVASIAKRVLSPRPARLITSALSITGYVAMCAIPMHFLTHRYYPSDPTPPIYAVGPAELDYEYVKLALHTWPWRSALAYLSLTAGVAWHASEGMKVLWNTYLRSMFGGWKLGARARAVGVAALILPLASGLWIIAQEPLIALPSQLASFQAALSHSLLYSF